MASETDNRVLRSFADDDRERVLASCERRYPAPGLVLNRVGEKTTKVFFPEPAVISTLATYRGGSVIEMASVGRGASTGATLVAGHPDQLSTNHVRIAGSSLEMSADDFSSLNSSVPKFEKSLFATVQAVFCQIMVSGACNGAHNARQRVARWVLTMDDRSDDDELELTQEFLAELLGLRRATVSEAASQLQDEGLIKYRRRTVRVTDRGGLQSASCERYEPDRRDASRLATIA